MHQIVYLEFMAAFGLQPADTVHRVSVDGDITTSEDWTHYGTGREVITSLAAVPGDKDITQDSTCAMEPLPSHEMSIRSLPIQLVLDCPDPVHDSVGDGLHEASGDIPFLPPKQIDLRMQRAADGTLRVEFLPPGDDPVPTCLDIGTTGFVVGGTPMDEASVVELLAPGVRDLGPAGVTAAVAHMLHHDQSPETIAFASILLDALKAL